MNSATKILDIAERRMRKTGYNAVSYRDIASELGIKSASLHYHFPKKSDLGEALVKRYSENFQYSLKQTSVNDLTPSQKLETFIDIYRTALKKQKLVCLCAVLGAEAPGLPDNVANEVRRFFVMNIDWLEQIYADLGGKNPRRQAQSTLAALEGAMIIASVNRDLEVFEAVAERILPQWVRQPRTPSPN